MSVTHDAIAGPGTFSGQTSVSWSHTVGSGSNRCLDVSVGVFTTGGSGSSHVSGITYGGVALTRIANQTQTNNGESAEVWRLKDPTSGTATVAITFSNSADGNAESQSLDGVDQTTSEGGAVNAQGTSTAPTCSPTGGSTGDMAIDAMAWDNGGTAVTATMTAVSGRTQIYNGGINPGEGGAGSRLADPANPQAMAWTLSASRGWATAGVVMKAAAGGGFDPSTVPWQGETPEPNLPMLVPF